jgi:Tol biopolymer transport system component
MRSTGFILTLIGSFCVATAIAQRPAVQPVEWIVQNAPGEGVEDQWAYIAPDGDTITFSRSVDGGRTFQLLVTDRRGKTPRPFLTTPPAASLTRGTWSRRHNRLAFNGNRPDGPLDVYVADASGRDVKRIALEGIAGLGYPSWTPDGRSFLGVYYGG